MTDNGSGEYTIDITSDKDVFKEGIGDSYFCVLRPDDGTDTGSGTYIDDTYVASHSVTAVYRYIDTRTAQVLVTDSGDSKYYTVYIHKKATVTGNYAAALAVKEEGSENLFSCSTNILSVKSNVSDFNLEVELENAQFAQDITSGNITLSQGFKDLEITRLARTSDTVVTIYLAGKIDKAYSSGDIVFDTGAVTGVEVLVSLSVNIENTQMYADFSTAKFTNSQLSFDIVLEDGQFKDTVVSELSGAADGATLLEVAANTARDRSTVKINAPAADIDAAMALINGGVLSVSGVSTDYNEKLSLELNSEQAVINANVDFIEADGAGYKATLILSTLNGTLQTLTAADISVSGSFESGAISNVTVTEVTNIDACTQVVFTFSCEDVDLEDALFSGSITVADGKLKNLWTTASNEKSAELCTFQRKATGERGTQLKGFGAHTAIQ